MVYITFPFRPKKRKTLCITKCIHIVMRKAMKIINIIRKHGGEAYLVGGCVRDMILNRNPNDYDIATNLLPKDIIKIFRKVIPTGIEHLTVTVIMEGEPFEITTYRADGDYSDGRHPDEVFASDTIEDDLSRRDFTMNAIAFDGEKYVDPFNGRKDIENGIIRAVGNTRERFNEDKLRAMRAIRFSSQLGFRINKAIIDELHNTSLDSVSRERIQKELMKLLGGKKPVESIEIMYDTGILKQIIPELTELKGLDGGKYHNEDVWEHTMKSLEATVQLSDNPKLRLSTLLHDIGKKKSFIITDTGVHFYGHEKTGVEVATNILKRLRFPRNTINYVTKLIRYHMVTYDKLGQRLTKKQIKRAVRNIGEDNLWDMMILNYSDDYGNFAYHTPSFEAFLLTKTFWFRWQEIKKEDSVMKVTDLAVNGHDMMELGYEGKEIGDILKTMLEKIDGDELSNDRDTLLMFASGS